MNDGRGQAYARKGPLERHEFDERVAPCRCSVTVSAQERTQENGTLRWQSVARVEAVQGTCNVYSTEGGAVVGY